MSEISVCHGGHYVFGFFVRYKMWWMLMHPWRQFFQCLPLIPLHLGQALPEPLLLGSKQEQDHDPVPELGAAYRVHPSPAQLWLVWQIGRSPRNRTRAKSRQRRRTRPSTSWRSCSSRGIIKWRLWPQSSSISSPRYLFTKQGENPHTTFNFLFTVFLATLRNINRAAFSMEFDSIYCCYMKLIKIIMSWMYW